MVERSWETLEHPILEAIGELEDSDESLGLPAVAEQAGIPVEQVRIGVRRLLGTDLLDGEDMTGWSGTFSAMNLRLRPKGRQAVGQWPSSDPAEAFLQALGQRIGADHDPEERSRLEDVQRSAGEVGKGVLAGIITAVVQQVTGLG